MRSIPSSQLIAWLRAAGEPSRLRLLVLCGQRDLSVSDLAHALGQSEPRVCRHLRILSDAGLIERLRNGQWVHYRLATSEAAAGFVRGLLAQLDRGDAQMARDLDRVRVRPDDAGVADGRSLDTEAAPSGAKGGSRNALSSDTANVARSLIAGGPKSGSRSVHPQTFESRLGRALKGFVEANTLPMRLDSALVVGVEHLELLESAASIASQCTAIAHSRRAAQSARAFAERRGFNCRVLLAATADGLSERDIDRAGRSFDVVILDHLATADTEFAVLLDNGRKALAPTGRLWLFERYESLEISREKVVEHPLARLRRLLGDQGLSCERLSPIEADDEHVLAAVAAPTPHREQPTLRHA
jgi:DNA-binding transcriptional ArsR family regulator